MGEGCGIDNPGAIGNRESQNPAVYHHPPYLDGHSMGRIPFTVNKSSIFNPGPALSPAS
jgi:hypothetical protein